MKIINTFKFIDAFTIFIFLRIITIAIKEGAGIELIKVITVFVATFFSFQYYPYLLRRFAGTVLKQAYLDFLSFCIIFIIIIFIFSLIRKGIKAIFPLEKRPLWGIWFSLPLGIIRASYFISVFIFSLYLVSPQDTPFKGSISSKIFRRLAPQSYIYLFRYYKKFNPEAKYNKEVERYYETERDLPPDSEKRNRG